MGYVALEEWRGRGGARRSSSRTGCCGDMSPRTRGGEPRLRDGDGDRHPARMAAEVCRLGGAAGRRGGVRGNRRPARMAVGVCRPAAGMTSLRTNGEGSATCPQDEAARAATIVDPHGWPWGYVASEEWQGGEVEARCRDRGRGRGTAVANVARTAAGVLGGAAGRGWADAAIVVPHGGPRGYVALDKGRGGGAEARCRGRGTAAKISTQSRPSDRGEKRRANRGGGWGMVQKLLKITVLLLKQISKICQIWLKLTKIGPKLHFLAL